MRSTIACSLILAGLAVAAPSRAQDSTAERAMAETLFRQGKKLMTDGKVAEACEKFDASYKIDHAGGTLINLAICHELEGRTATAWTEFQEALAMARTSARADRQKAALEHIAKLEPRLSMLKVGVRGASPQGLLVKLDGVVMAPTVLGSAIPVDPGDHRVWATADGMKPWEAKVRITEAQALSVTVPELEPAKPALPESSEPAEALPPPLAAPEGSRPDPVGKWKTPLGVTALVAGAAGLGVGIYFGARALKLGNQVSENCPKMGCNSKGLVDLEDGRTAAGIATPTVIAGSVLAATGVAFLVVSSVTAQGDGRTASTRLRVEPMVGPGVAFLRMGGAF